MFYHNKIVQNNNIRNNHCSFLPYTESEINAIIAGFQEVADEGFGYGMETYYQISL